MGIGSYRSSVSTTGGAVTDHSENPAPPSSPPYLLLSLHLFVPSTSSLLFPLSLLPPSVLALLPSTLPSYALFFRSSRIWARSLSIPSLLSFLSLVPCNLLKCVPFGCSYNISPVLFSDQFALRPDRI